MSEEARGKEVQGTLRLELVQEEGGRARVQTLDVGDLVEGDMNGIARGYLSIFILLLHIYIYNVCFICTISSL